MPSACVYTFCFYGVTFVFIRYSGETFFYFEENFYCLARLFFIQGDFFCIRSDFFIWRNFFFSARLFFTGATFFLFDATVFIRRDFFTMARLFAVAHFLIAGSNTCLKQYFSNMAEIAVEVENDLEKASIWYYSS